MISEKLVEGKTNSLPSMSDEMLVRLFQRHFKDPVAAVRRLDAHLESVRLPFDFYAQLRELLYPPQPGLPNGMPSCTYYFVPNSRRGTDQPTNEDPLHPSFVNACDGIGLNLGCPVRLLRALDALEQWPTDENVPEARYLLSLSLRALDRKQEALDATLTLLRTAQTSGDPKRWTYWQRRTGNQLANDFFESGDTHHALLIYQGLSALTPEPEWREWFFTRHAGLPCPVLDLEKGQCRLYLHRPVACRLAGPLIQIGHTCTDPCHLCFQGVSVEEIKTTKIVIQVDDFNEIPTESETLIAYIL